MESKKQPPHINVDYFEDLTGDIGEGDDCAPEAIGCRVQRLRREKGLSLEDLSQLTGFEVDLLKRIETDEIQPQLGTIIRLSKALDRSLARLVSGGKGGKRYSLTRRGESKAISRSTTAKGQRAAYRYMSLAPEVDGRHMEALLVELAPNTDDETSVHEGEEFIYVLEGRVGLKLGEDAFTLDPGDSIYYLSTVPHVLTAIDKPAVILAVIYDR
ncbi:MAG: XRE family transcriptional regulator [Desulfosarcinaceae bacterium]|nr:XRE family transcriptional regulator [Desulfosarcinaceae bacterium]